MKIEYLANTGFLLIDEAAGKKILIDAIHSAPVRPYKETDATTIEKMVRGIAPYDNLDLLLFTHHHEDHFSARDTLRILKGQQSAPLFSTPKTLALLKDHEEYDPALAGRLHTLSLSQKETKVLSLNGVAFACTNLAHDGKEYADVDNYCYTLYLEGERVFHCGDAQPSESNFENTGIPRQKITTALLDFPYLTLAAGRKVIQNFIQPRSLYIMHLPEASQDGYGWLDAVRKSEARYGGELPPMVLCL